MHLDIYEAICVKLGMMTGIFDLNILILVLSYLDFYSRSQG